MRVEMSPRSLALFPSDGFFRVDLVPLLFSNHEDLVPL